MATGRIFQPVRGRGLRKLLWKRLYLPRAVVHPVLSAAKVAANPAQVRLRREVAADCRSAFEISPAAGFRLLSDGELPGADAAVDRCAEIFRRMRAEDNLEEYVFNRHKRFLLALLAGADFCAHPELIRLMISRPVLDTATAYLGEVPILAGAALWWTPENETAERSQLFHFDGEDERQLKLILNVFDTREEHGPFTLLPAAASAPLRRSSSLRRRIPDAQVDAACGLGQAVALQGSAGSGGFVDTSRCLHFGSRRSRKQRLVLMAQFTRFQCPTESTFAFAVPPGLPGLDPDPIQKLALGLV